jgi:hypothetical protein
VQGGLPGSPGKLVFLTQSDRLRSDAAERGVQQPDEAKASLGVWRFGLRGEGARVHGCFFSQSLRKAGSVRNESQIGSSSKKAGVMGAGP